MDPSDFSGRPEFSKGARVRLLSDPNSCVHGKVIKMKTAGGLPIEITVDWFDKANGPTQSVHNVADLFTLEQSEYDPSLEN